MAIIKEEKESIIIEIEKDEEISIENNIIVISKKILRYQNNNKLKA